MLIRVMHGLIETINVSIPSLIFSSPFESLVPVIWHDDDDAIDDDGSL